jgi:hypothetical protein
LNSLSDLLGYAHPEYALSFWHGSENTKDFESRNQELNERPLIAPLEDFASRGGRRVFRCADHTPKGRSYRIEFANS